MSKIPVMIEIPIYEEILCLEGFSSTPNLDIHMDAIQVGNGMMQYMNRRYSWKDIELDFSDSISLKQSQYLMDWLYGTFSQYCEKKTIKLKSFNHNSDFTLIGAFPRSFEQKIDDENNVRNERKLTRKVLFEKKGNETISIYLNMSLSVDNVLCDNEAIV